MGSSNNARLRLSGKTAIITGAGRGIGAALARAFAQEGASVVVNYAHSAGAAAAVAESIESAGGKAVAVRADVADPGQHHLLVEAALEHFGRLDILVNNAGIELRAPVLEITPEQWDQVQATTLRGAFFMAQAAARHMREHGGGAILNISSVHDERAHRGNAAYTAAKGGLKLLTRCLALELAEFGVRVNGLAPGAILTDINRNVLADEAFRHKVVDTIPLGRIGEADDLAAAAVLLVSSDAAYITGTTVYVDGGMLL